VIQSFGLDVHRFLKNIHYDESLHSEHSAIFMHLEVFYVSY